MSQTENPIVKILADHSDPTDISYCRIGNVTLEIPPDQITVSKSTDHITVPSVRAGGDTLLKSGFSNFYITIKSYFFGEQQIKEKLLPIIAMYKVTPIILISNKFVADQVYGAVAELSRSLSRNFSNVVPNSGIAADQQAEVVRQINTGLFQGTSVPVSMDSFSLRVLSDYAGFNIEAQFNFRYYNNAVVSSFFELDDAELTARIKAYLDISEKRRTEVMTDVHTLGINSSDPNEFVVYGYLYNSVFRSGLTLSEIDYLYQNFLYSNGLDPSTGYTELNNPASVLPDVPRVPPKRILPQTTQVVTIPEGAFIWPVRNHQVTTTAEGHSNRASKPGYTPRPALDIVDSSQDKGAPGWKGGPVYASKGGTVTKSLRYTDYTGYMIQIDSLEGGTKYSLQYIHMNGTYLPSYAPVGRVVNQGDQIGFYEPTTDPKKAGHSTGPHLDFKVMVNGVYVDPLKYLEGGEVLNPGQGAGDSDRGSRTVNSIDDILSNQTEEHKIQAAAKARENLSELFRDGWEPDLNKCSPNFIIVRKPYKIPFLDGSKKLVGSTDIFVNSIGLGYSNKLVHLPIVSHTLPFTQYMGASNSTMVLDGIALLNESNYLCPNLELLQSLFNMKEHQIIQLKNKAAHAPFLLFDIQCVNIYNPVLTLLGYTAFVMNDLQTGTIPNTPNALTLQMNLTENYMYDAKVNGRSVVESLFNNYILIEAIEKSIVDYYETVVKPMNDAERLKNLDDLLKLNGNLNLFVMYLYIKTHGSAGFIETVLGPVTDVDGRRRQREMMINKVAGVFKSEWPAIFSAGEFLNKSAVLFASIYFEAATSNEQSNVYRNKLREFYDTVKSLEGAAPPIFKDIEANVGKVFNSQQAISGMSMKDLDMKSCYPDLLIRPLVAPASYIKDTGINEEFAAAILDATSSIIDVVGNDFPTYWPQQRFQQALKVKSAAEDAESTMNAGDYRNQLTKYGLPSRNNNFLVDTFFTNSLTNQKDVDAAKVTNSSHTAQTVKGNITKKNEILSYNMSYPGFKIYLIEDGQGDAEDDLFGVRFNSFDSFYDYSAIVEIEIGRFKHEVDVAVIKMLNTFNSLTTRVLSDSMFIEPARMKDIQVGGDSVFVGNERVVRLQDGTLVSQDQDTGKLMPISRLMLQEGTKIAIKLGYDNNESSMPVVFTGLVAEVQPGDVVTIVCQGFMSELKADTRINEYGGAWEKMKKWLQSQGGVVGGVSTAFLDTGDSVTDPNAAPGVQTMAAVWGDGSWFQRTYYTVNNAFTGYLADFLLQSQSCLHFGRWSKSAVVSSRLSQGNYPLISGSFYKYLSGQSSSRATENVDLSLFTHWQSKVGLEKIHGEAAFAKFYMDTKANPTIWSTLFTAVLRHPLHLITVRPYGADATLIIKTPHDLYATKKLSYMEAASDTEALDTKKRTFLEYLALSDKTTTPNETNEARWRKILLANAGTPPEKGGESEIEQRIYDLLINKMSPGMWNSVEIPPELHGYFWLGTPMAYSEFVGEFGESVVGAIFNYVILILIIPTGGLSSLAWFSTNLEYVVPCISINGNSLVYSLYFKVGGFAAVAIPVTNEDGYTKIFDRYREQGNQIPFLKQDGMWAGGVITILTSLYATMVLIPAGPAGWSAAVPIWVTAMEALPNVFTKWTVKVKIKGCDELKCVENTTLYYDRSAMKNLLSGLTVDLAAKDGGQATITDIRQTLEYRSCVCLDKLMELLKTIGDPNPLLGFTQDPIKQLPQEFIDYLNSKAVDGNFLEAGAARKALSAFKGMVPVTQIHHVSSYTNLIYNAIRTNGNISNTIVITAGPGGEDYPPMKVDDNLVPNYVRTKVISSEDVGGNTGGIFSQFIGRASRGLLGSPSIEYVTRLAELYTLSHLKLELEKMYIGEIALIGNPYIQPFDQICLSDAFNEMTGTFVVDSVIHRFSADEGFVTFVTPHLIVEPSNVAMAALSANYTEAYKLGVADKRNHEDSAYKRLVYGMQGDRAISYYEESDRILKALVKAGVSVPQSVAAPLIGASGTAVGAYSGGMLGMGLATYLGMKAANLALNPLTAYLQKSSSSLITELESTNGMVLGEFANEKLIKPFGDDSIFNIFTQNIFSGLSNWCMNNSWFREPVIMKPLEVRGVPFVAGIRGSRKSGFLDWYVDGLASIMHSIGYELQAFKEGFRQGTKTIELVQSVWQLYKNTMGQGVYGDVALKAVDAVSQSVGSASSSDWDRALDAAKKAEKGLKTPELLKSSPNTEIGEPPDLKRATVPAKTPTPATSDKTTPKANEGGTPPATTVTSPAETPAAPRNTNTGAPLPPLTGIDLRRPMRVTIAPLSPDVPVSSHSPEPRGPRLANEPALAPSIPRETGSFYGKGPQQ